MTLSLAACGAGEKTTHTGIVVFVDGTVISLVEMDTGNMGGRGEVTNVLVSAQSFFGGGNSRPTN